MADPTINDAIDAGVSVSQIGSVRTEFRSVDELLKIRRDQALRDAQASGAPRVSRVTILCDKGL